jgi:hypothetical protein
MTLRTSSLPCCRTDFDRWPWCRPTFSERGCQEKHLPADRPPGRNTFRGSQPLLRRDDQLIRRGKVSTLHDNWVFSSETEKQTAALIADHSSL